MDASKVEVKATNKSKDIYEESARGKSFSEKGCLAVLHKGTRDPRLNEDGAGGGFLDAGKRFPLFSDGGDRRKRRSGGRWFLREMGCGKIFIA